MAAERLKQIDILRALAVFLVLGRHMTPCPADYSAFLHKITVVWARGGWVGVDLFFVLSGFLVSGLLFREYEKYRELQIGRFLIRRGFKIYPPFWLLIGVTVIVSLVRYDDIPVRATASELLFLQNYALSLWNHTWSLAVEEHFYLLLAFAFYFFVQQRATEPFRMIPVWFAVVGLLCLALRIHAVYSEPYNFQTHLFPTHLRLDGLFFGVLLAYLFHRHPAVFLAAARRFKYLLAFLGTMLLVPAFCVSPEDSRFVATFGLTLFYLGSGMLLVFALGIVNPGSFFWKAVAYIGSHSYSVYLWHMPVVIWGASSLGGGGAGRGDWAIYAAVYLIGSIGIGIGMALLVEFPTLHLRDHLFPSRGKPLTKYPEIIEEIPTPMK